MKPPKPMTTAQTDADRARARQLARWTRWSSPAARGGPARCRPAAGWLHDRGQPSRCRCSVELVDAVEHAGAVHPGAHDERHELLEVGELGAEPGHHHRQPGVEDRLQQQRRDQQQPLAGDRLAGDQHDGRPARPSRRPGCWNWISVIDERQAGPGEVQRPDQPRLPLIAWMPAVDRGLGEAEDEHAGAQVGDEVGDARAWCPAARRRSGSRRPRWSAGSAPARAGPAGRC